MKTWTSWILVAVVSGLLLFTNLGGWGLWSPDEPRYAEVAREMVLTGDYLVPHLNGRVYTRKPPLLFWLDAISYKIFGVKEWAARLPVVLAGLSAVLATMYLGTRLFSPTVGLWGGLILVTTPWFTWEARRAKMDIPLTFLVLLAIIAFYLGNLADREEKKKKFIYYALGFSAVGIGALGKGPVAFSVPGLALACYHIHTRDLHILKEKEFWLAFPLAFLFYFAWLVPACFKLGGKYALDQIYYKTSALFLHTKVHRHGPLFYLYHLPLDAFPWVLFIPGALIYGLRLPRERRRPFLLLFWWFVANFVFFSIAKTKRSTYLLPLYPAMALMVALYLRETLREADFLDLSSITKGVKYPFYLILFTLPLVAIGAPLAAYLKVRMLFAPLAALGSVLLVFALLGLAVLKKKLLPLREYITVMMVITLLFSFLLVIPRADPCKSVKAVCRKAVELSKRDKAPLMLFGITTPHAGEFNFYTGMAPLPVVRRGERNLQKVLETQDKVYLITKGRYFQRYCKKLELKPLAQQPCGHRFTLFSNKDFQGGSQK